MSTGDNKVAAGPRACFLPLNMKIDEIGQIYRNVLREKEGGLLRFRNIYQFSQIDELMEELTGWIIGFHEKIDTEYRKNMQMGV